MSNKYLISGFIGANNIGDEIILKSVVSLINKVDKGSDFTVLSFAPEETKKCFNINSVYWSGLTFELFKKREILLNVIKKVKESDKVIIGGGGLLQDVHSYATIPRYLIIALLAKYYNKPIIYFSLGIGPIKNKILRYATKIISQEITHITVRDKESKDYLNEVGVKREDINVTADPALALSDFIDVQNKKENFNKDQRKLGVSVRSFRMTNDLKEEIIATINYIIDNFNIEVYLIPMNKEDDLDLCKNISDAVKEKVLVYYKYDSPRDIVRKISEMDFMISMRLHGLIVGASYGIPLIGLAYDPKVNSFLNSIGLSEYNIELENCTFNVLVNKFSSMINKEKELKNKIRHNTDKRKKELYKSVEFITNNLENNKKNIFSLIYYFIVLISPQLKNKIKKLFEPK